MPMNWKISISANSQMQLSSYMQQNNYKQMIMNYMCKVLQCKTSVIKARLSSCLWVTGSHLKNCPGVFSVTHIFFEFGLVQSLEKICGLAILRIRKDSC